MSPPTLIMSPNAFWLLLCVSIPYFSVLGDTEVLINYLLHYGYVHYVDSPVLPLLDLNSSIDCAKADLGLPLTSESDGEFYHLLTLPRCGNPPSPHVVSRRRRYSFVGGRLRLAPITVCLDSNYLDPTIPASTVFSSLQWVTGQIQSFTKATFNISWCDSNILSDIRVVFVPTFHNCVSSFSKGELGHALSPLSSSGLHLSLGLDTKSDDGYTSQFLFTLSHEISHSLGLGHVPLRNSLMFPTYMGEKKLISDLFDIDTILGYQKLYGRNPSYNIPVISHLSSDEPSS